MGLLSEIPPNVARAFYGYDEWEVEAFASRWGGLHTGVFARVLDEGQGDDKVFAIFVIGYLDETWAQQRMWSFVESPIRKERWASAYCLGVRHNEDALPYLKKILVDAFDPTEDMSLEEEGWYAVQRDYVVELLTSWGSATVVPELRQSFLAVQAWREARLRINNHLFFYQDTLAYALGRYGAMGALTGITLPLSHLRVAIVYLALGNLHAKERYETSIDYAMISNKDLQHEVEEVLSHHFGLTESERQDIITTFWGNKQQRKEGNLQFREDETDEIENEVDENISETEH